MVKVTKIPIIELSEKEIHLMSAGLIPLKVMTKKEILKIYRNPTDKPKGNE